MNTTPASPDPVPQAIDSLASARWTREPDWRTFQESLMHARTPRFQFLRAHPVLLASIAALALCGGAAAAAKVYQLLHFTGTATLDDGTTYQVEGDIVLDNDTWTATATTSDPNATPAKLDVTLSDGSTATIVTSPVDEHGNAITPPKQSPPVAPHQPPHPFLHAPPIGPRRSVFASSAITWMNAAHRATTLEFLSRVVLTTPRLTHACGTPA